MKLRTSLAFAIALIGWALAPSSQASTELVVYTALETDQLRAYQKAFNAVHPEITLRWVRDSTGVITAKLLAERANPQADVIWGVAASSLALLARNGQLDPYAPANLAAIAPRYRDADQPPAWWGMDVFGATVCFNTIEAKKYGIAEPKSWHDLTKPEFRGRVAMPNPASSGTGYLDVTAWLALWGDDAGQGGGWTYMDALHRNIGQYTHSGSKPCNMAAAGETVAGISFEYRAQANKSRGAPITLVFPAEGLGWDLEAFAIHKGTKQPDAARTLADWASSREAMTLYGRNFAITAVPGTATKLPDIPADYESRLVNVDFDRAARERERILAEWSRRYDAKSEPKAAP